MSSNREASDNDSHSDLPKAVSLTNARSNPLQQPATIAHAPAFDQFNDKLFKSIQQCIDSALEPLAQRMADIEKALIIRTASIAEQVSTVSLNQQVLHQNLLDIMAKVEQLQFEEQSMYSDEESLSSFDVPAKRSARNADNVSVCSTEASEYLYNSDEEEDEEDDDDDDGGDSVCTETAETLNQFRVPEASAINAERYNQFTRIESRKYTAKFSNTNQATPPSSLSSNQINATTTSTSDKPKEQTKQTAPVSPQIIPGIPVVPLTTPADATATKATMSTSSSMSANAPISSAASIDQTKVSLPPTTPTVLKKEPVLTTEPANKIAQPITIAPITVSIPAPSTTVPAAEPPTRTNSTEASSEPALPPSDPVPIPSPVVTVPQVEVKGNRSRSNQRRNRRDHMGDTFTYVHFQYIIASRTKCKDIRTELTGIGIKSRKMLDVYFPGKRVAAVLFPDSYVEEAINILQRNNFTVLMDFDPLDSKHLGDPKYKHLSKEERNAILREFHEKQMCRAIDRISYPTKSDVYKDFYKKGWISEDKYTYYLFDIFRTAKTAN